MKLALMVLVLCGVLLCSVSALPQITHTDGVLVDGASFTIRGSGFGSKSPVEPQLWDDFEEGGVDNPIGEPVYGVYENVRNNVYTDFNSYAGSQSALGRFGPDYGSGGLISSWLDYSDAAFASMKVLVDHATDDLMTPSNVKFLRVHSHNDPSGSSPEMRGRPNMVLGVERNQTSVKGIANIGGSLGQQKNIGAFSQIPNPGDWNDIAVWGSLSSPACDGPCGDGPCDDSACAQNGLAGWLAGGEWYEEVEVTQWLDEEYAPGFKTAYFVGYMDASAPGFHSVYLDDIYADNTLSRVFLSTSDGVADFGKTAMQIPQNVWSDDHIEVSVNLGGFTAQEIANGLFLFVVDEFGAVSDAHPLTGDGSVERLVFEDFEDNDWTDSFDGTFNPANVALTSEVAIGSVSSRMSDEEGLGARFDYVFDNHGLPNVSPGDKYYVRYYVQYGPTLDWTQVSMTGWKQFRAVPPDGWPLIMMKHGDADGNTNFDLYTHSYYESLDSGIPSRRAAPFEPSSEEWHLIEVYLSWGVNEGGFSYYIDEELFAGVPYDDHTYTNWPRDVGTPVEFVDGLWLAGGNGQQDDLVYYIDNVEIWKGFPSSTGETCGNGICIASEVGVCDIDCQSLTCPNMVCGSNEDYWSCPQDCDPTLSDFITHTFSNLHELVLFGRAFQ